ncbi:hypothetical protein R1flu_012147 [Riccia fluitans]|uniref:Sulfite exporter TauE/SafE family protein n=1 Tax=Riccia fluitans TaxID=41844 RepID=A0ABD1ZA09_9MARC
MAFRGWGSMRCFLGIIALTLIACVGAESTVSCSKAPTPRRFADIKSNNGKFEEGQKWTNWTLIEAHEHRAIVVEWGYYHWPKLELNARSVAAIILGGVGASLCTAAGLGGGGLFIPLFNLLLQFDSKTSAALSNFMILGGQLVTMMLNLPRSHPFQEDKPLIDFESALLLQPNLLLGISVGVLLNVVFPSWLVTLCLIVVLGSMTISSLKNGVKRWKKESQQFVTAISDGGLPAVQASSGIENGILDEPLLEKHRVKLVYPLKKILALAVVWLAFFAVQLIRTQTEKCSVVYWIITATQIPFALIVTYFALQNQLKSCPSFPEGSKTTPVNDGFLLGPKESYLLPKLALGTGVIGGMLGTGGSMIMSPVLLHAGMHPQVTAATSGFMVVFSSSMSVVQYWLLGMVPMDWALSGAGLSAVFSVVGILVVQRLVQKYGRASLIVFIVAFVVGLSAVTMASVGGYNVWERYEAGSYMGFNSPC